MLTINLVTETYEYPETDSDIDIPDDPTSSEGCGSVCVRAESVSFRELISLMREYSEPSCSPASGAAFEWLSRSETDYRTGDYIVDSLHYARENPARNLKYWRAAMRAAGFIK